MLAADRQSDVSLQYVKLEMLSAMCFEIPTWRLCACPCIQNVHTAGWPLEPPYANRAMLRCASINACLLLWNHALVTRLVDQRAAVLPVCTRHLLSSVDVNATCSTTQVRSKQVLCVLCMRLSFVTSPWLAESAMQLCCTVAIGIFGTSRW